MARAGVPTHWGRQRLEGLRREPTLPERETLAPPRCPWPRRQCASVLRRVVCSRPDRRVASTRGRRAQAPVGPVSFGLFPDWITGVTMKAVIAAIFVAAAVLSVSAQYQQCGRGENCGEGECCMLTGVRYGVPTCHPLTRAGDTCRPSAKPENFTLAPGPFEKAVEFTNVYWAVCPCESGLVCSSGTCA